MCSCWSCLCILLTSHLSGLPGECQERETAFEKFKAKLENENLDAKTRFSDVNACYLDVNTRLHIIEGDDFEITFI